MRRKLIYIGGYGWSGSTLLTRILMRLPNVQSLGEFHYCLQDLSANNKCSCGAAAADCLFWSKYYTLNQNENITEAQLRQMIFQDHPDQLFIDASKTTYPHHNRPAALAKEYDLIFIHLVRDGKKVLASNLRRSGFFKTIKTITTAMQWRLANQSGDRFGKQKLGKYFLLRYEDMIRFPENLLSEMAELIGIESEGNNMDWNDLPLGHQLSGNAIRFKTPLRIEVQPDREEVLGKKYQLFKWLNYSRLKAYGYR